MIRRAFDRNRDGQLDAQERAGVRLILYGQSFGGAAAVKLARELERMGARRRNYRKRDQWTYVRR
jgi:hypothetical protein